MCERVRILCIAYCCVVCILFFDLAYSASASSSHYIWLDTAALVSTFWETTALVSTNLVSYTLRLQSYSKVIISSDKNPCRIIFLTLVHPPPPIFQLDNNILVKDNYLIIVILNSVKRYLEQSVNFSERSNGESLLLLLHFEFLECHVFVCSFVSSTKHDTVSTFLNSVQILEVVDIPEWRVYNGGISTLLWTWWWWY